MVAECLHYFGFGAVDACGDEDIVGVRIVEECDFSSVVFDGYLAVSCSVYIVFVCHKCVYLLVD